MTDIRLRVETGDSDRAQLLGLVAQVADATGHVPLDENKHAQILAGAGGWSAAVADDGGRPVGYAHVRWNPPGSEPRAAVEVVVHPDRADADLPARLLAAARTLVADRGGGLVHVWEHRVGDPAATTAARLGLTVQRELAYMTRPLGSRPREPALPAGVMLRAYRPGVDDRELLRVNNAAFRGHPENGDWDQAELAARRSYGWFDPQGLLLAWRDDELLGFHWTKRHAPGPAAPGGPEPAGEVYVLAVHPDAQGLGLGGALLDAGLAHLYDRGCRVAVLYVDTASRAAVRTYAAAGFAVAHREVCYQDRVGPGG